MKGDPYVGDNWTNYHSYILSNTGKKELEMKLLYFFIAVCYILGSIGVGKK